MRIQTRGNSTTVWLSSDEGVIDGTMTMSAPTLEKILQAVNEKYGTSFEGWSQLPTAYEVGDTVPNWNAYEKIVLPERIYINLQTNSGNTGSFAGFIQGNKFHWYTQNNGSKIIVVSNAAYNIGTIVALIDWEQSLENNVLQAISNNYPNVDDIETYDVEWSQGDIVPNWANYTYIAR